MVRNLLLTEFQSAPGIHLNRNELDTLLQSSASLTIVPSPATVDIYTITPSSKIGAIKLNNLSVVIQPKVAISRVLFLLSYLFNPRG